MCVCVTQHDSYHYRKWNWRSEFNSWMVPLAFHFAPMPFGKT